MLVIVAKRMARASFVGPSHAAMRLRLPAIELALDRVARHHGIVHQQPQRDDQGGDRNLLDVDAERGPSARTSSPA